MSEEPPAEGMEPWLLRHRLPGEYLPRQLSDRNRDRLIAATQSGVRSKAWSSRPDIGSLRLNGGLGFETGRGADHLFESSRKKPYSTRGVRATLTRYATLTGIAHPISPRRLRHFLFTWFRRRHQPPLLLARSRHASIRSLE